MTGMNGLDPNVWVSMEAAVEETGRSESTLKRAVRAGKVEKRMVSAPGRRPEAYLLRGDVEHLFGGNAVPATMARLPEAVTVNDPTAALVPVTGSDRPLTINGLIDVLRRPEIELKDKLCWTLDEARIVTGLNRPALRAVIARLPNLTVWQGRRMWIKAGELRKVLGAG